MPVLSSQIPLLRKLYQYTTMGMVSFITFGDSKSDVGMAEEIHRLGFSVEFVFVGGKEQLQSIQLPFPISFTQAFCEKGTVEYLKNRPHEERA